MYERVTTIGFRTCEYVVLIAVLSRWAGAKWFRTRESGFSLGSRGYIHNSGLGRWSKAIMIFLTSWRRKDLGGTVMACEIIWLVA